MATQIAPSIRPQEFVQSYRRTPPKTQEPAKVINLFPKTVSDMVQQDLLKEYVNKNDDAKFKFNPNLIKLLVQKNRNLRSEYFIDFIQRCQITGADPRKNQAYLVTYNRTVNEDGQKSIEVHGTTIFSYHFLLAKAEATKQLQGWKVTTKIEDYLDYQTGKISPQLCSYAQVKKKGREEILYRAWYPEFAKYVDNRPTEMWRNKPYLMLEKCALANGIRQSFPDMFSGMYISEEILGEESLQITDKPSEDFSFKEGEYALSELPCDTPRTNRTATYNIPTNTIEKQSDAKGPGEYVFNFGKYRGQRMRDINNGELVRYVSYLDSKSKTEDIGQNTREFLENWKAWQAEKAAPGPEQDFDTNEAMPEDVIIQQAQIPRRASKKNQPISKATMTALWGEVVKLNKKNPSIKLPAMAEKLRNLSEDTGQIILTKFKNGEISELM
ncbi:MAG: recombinase RecT [Pseudobdellovibrionaceae bacterium]